MTRHDMIKLGVAAAVALGLALWAGNARQPQTEAPRESALVPGLDAAVNEVRTLVITGAGNTTIATLERGERVWTVREKGGYPADVAKIRETLLKLSRARLLEAKTANPELYAKLGVEDVAKADAKGAQLEITGLKEPVKLVIGNYNGRGGDSTFVRRAGEKQSWLAQGNLTLERSGANWLARDLTDIASSRIVQVEITGGGKTLRVFKDTAASPNYTIADVPRGREPASEFVANALASTLGGLRFDDVRPAAQSAPPADAPVFDVKYTMFDGLVVTARAWQHEGKDLAQLDASLDEARAAKAIEAAQAQERATHEAAVAAAAAAPKPAATPAADPASAATPAPGDPGAAAPPPPLAVSDPEKDRTQRLDALNKEAAALDARFAGWTFVLPAYKFANMNKTLEDMLKPREGATPAKP